MIEGQTKTQKEGDEFEGEKGKIRHTVVWLGVIWKRSLAVCMKRRMKIFFTTELAKFNT